MGMYTGIQISAVLKADLPNTVVAALEEMTLVKESNSISPIQHEFFSCDRWTHTLCCQSAYFSECKDDQPEVERRFFKLVNGKYILNASASLKNYDGEIAKFLDWIAPYVDPEGASDCGWYRYEEDRSVTTFRFDNGKVIKTKHKSKNEDWEY